MINTFFESELHKSIKILYAHTENGQMEVEVEGKICDVVTNKRIIEIQTGSLDKLKNKLESLLPTYSVTVVHPIVTKKYIKTTFLDGKTTQRISPKKQNIYHIFKELTSLHPFLLHPNFTLEIIETEIIEERKKITPEEKKLVKNKKLRKDWIKTGKQLKKIGKKYTFASATDYINLLPKDLPLQFSSNHMKKITKEANCMLWVLKKAQIIEVIGKEKNRYIYKIKGLPQEVAP